MRALGLISYGEYIHLERRRQKLTCTELARKAGIGRSTLWRIEKSDLTIELSSLAKVLEALGVEMRVKLKLKEDNQNEL